MKFRLQFQIILLIALITILKNLNYLHQIVFENGNRFRRPRASSTIDPVELVRLVLFCADTSTRAYRNITIRKMKFANLNIVLGFDFDFT